MQKSRKIETISIVQLMRLLPNDDACYVWLERVRWDGAPTCDKCGDCKRISQPKSKLHTYWCGKCRNNFTVTAGTIMHSTKTSLQNWAYAIYSIMHSPQGC